MLVTMLAPNSKVVAFRATPRISEILHEAGPIIDYLPCVHASRAHWLVFIDKANVSPGVSFTCRPCRSLAVRCWSLIDTSKQNGSILAPPDKERTRYGDYGGNVRKRAQQADVVADMSLC